jgi:valyl-tRNA synthetase
MGWPEQTEDLKTFYPTDLMSTGFDIIFFWVARMIMMGLKFAGDIPFRHVFINGLVRDIKKRKMSKSEGNIIDPLEMIEKYGTDALRFTLAALAIPGMDISLSGERMAGYRAFANKIWNAARFVLMSIKGTEFRIKEEELTLADRWIRNRLTAITEELNDSLENYRFYEAAEKVYHFIWHEFCDWYIELVKPSLREGNRTSEAVLVETLDQILRLLHPFMPFITEEIWQHLPCSGKSLAVASFPQVREDLKDEGAEKKMKILQEAVTGIRTIRAENKIPPKQEIELWAKVGDEKEKRILLDNQVYVQVLANIRKLEVCDQFPQGRKLLKGVAGSWEIGIPIEEGLFNLEQERQRLEKELSKVMSDMEKIEKRLQDRNFLSRAPKDFIQETEQRLEKFREKRSKLEESIVHLLSLMDQP